MQDLWDEAWAGFSNADFNVTATFLGRALRRTNSMKTKSGFFGVYPMVYALFDDKDNLARDPMRRQVQPLSKHKVHRIGVSNAGVRTLHRAHLNFSILKREATAIAIAKLLDEVEGELDVFNGRDGIEMLDSMRAGAVGIIPGGEAFDVLTQAFDHMASGTEAGIAEAERLYAKVLPLLILLMESMDTFLVYGKPVLGHRLGIAETKPRLPSTPPTAFGLAMAKRYAEMLG